MLFSDLLDRRVRTDGARPFLTWYGPPGSPGGGVAGRPRTELSAISFNNWVSKTGNLLTGTLGLTAGDGVAMPLARSHPEHWMTLVWVAACWRAGTAVVLDDPACALAEVVGPELDLTGAPDRLACSLHPLGLGFAPGLLPDGVLDYATEVRTEADAYLGGAAGSQDPAWRDAERTLSQQDLLTAEGVRPTAGRVLVTGGRDAWWTVATAVLGPLLGGGSAVLVSEPSDADLGVIAASERVG